MASRRSSAGLGSDPCSTSESDCELPPLQKSAGEPADSGGDGEARGELGPVGPFLQRQRDRGKTPVTLSGEYAGEIGLEGQNSYTRTVEPGGWYLAGSKI